MKKAYYRNIPCYYDEVTHDIEGRNKLYDIFLDIAMWFDLNILDVDDFPIWVEMDE